MKPQPGFIDHLEQLIALFRKLRALHAHEQMQGVDASFFQTVDILLDNYDLIRSTVPREMLEQLGRPIHELIIELIDQLRDELGEAAELNDDLGAVVAEIRRIDAELSARDLSSAEIDALLDQRTRLMNQRDNTAE